MTIEDTTENFRSIVGSSDLLRSRWDAVCDKIGAESEARLGVRLTPDDIITLPSARLACITEDSLDPEAWQRESLQIPAVAAARAKAETAAKLAAGDAETLETFGRMTRAERLTAARSMGTTPPPANRPKDAAEEARLLRLVNSLSPSLRIAKAREFGLI